MVTAIVIYNSRGGNTRKVAEKIAEGLEVECVNHKNIPKNIEDYDLLVLGTWPMMFKVRGKSKRWLTKFSKKKIDGKKVVLFFTSAGPDEVLPSTKDTNPKLIKEMVFETMESIINAENKVTILDERFYSLGALRMFGKIMDKEGHPTEEELGQAKAFGEMLKEKFNA
ncbi:MAG: flavodoxin domain-containing protein [Candidatus Heimdallarchaeota archaeon]|nr:flavodoxin domain-containing protein [Candidatus Heimdallarchaeota archaeon]